MYLRNKLKLIVKARMHLKTGYLQAHIRRKNIQLDE